jgi:hypothetical protein
MGRRIASRISWVCRKGSEVETKDPSSRTSAAEGDGPPPNAGHAPLPSKASCPARVPSKLTYEQLLAMRVLTLEQFAAFPPTWAPMEDAADRTPEEVGALIRRLSEDKFLFDALGLSGLDDQGQVLLPAIVQRLGDPLKRLHGLAEGQLSEEELRDAAHGENEKARQARLVLEGCDVLLEEVDGD